MHPPPLDTIFLSCVVHPDKSALPRLLRRSEAIIQRSRVSNAINVPIVGLPFVSCTFLGLILPHTPAPRPTHVFCQAAVITNPTYSAYRLHALQRVQYEGDHTP